MTTNDYELPSFVIAALRSPPGTTTEEIYAQFPDATSTGSTAAQMDSDVADFRVRYQDALEDWYDRSGGKQMPEAIADELGEQVRADIAWERGLSR